MSMPPHINGGWPELPPVPPPIEELPPNATPPQIMRALGSTLLMFGQLWPRVVQALEYLKRRDDERERQAIPPMRAPLASTSDLAKAVGHDVAQEFEREQRNPSTPPPNGATVAAMVQEQVQVALIRVKADALQKEKDFRDEMDREKRRGNWKMAVAAVVGAIAITVALVEHFTR